MNVEPPLSFRGSPDPRAFIDPGWKPLLTQITTLKDALDHAFRWQGEGGNEEWINAVLRRHGLALEHFKGTSHQEGPHFADRFVFMLLGVEFRSKFGNGGDQMMTIPPWAVLGWVRKESYRDTPSAPMKKLKFEARDANEWDPEGYTSFWSGFPLFLAGEGKNRTQLHRLAGVHRRAPVHEMPFPVIEGFVASPVPFFPWAVAIRSETHPVQVLPFRGLTQDLVGRLGLQWSHKPCWRALAKLMGMVRPLEFARWRKLGPGRGLGVYLQMRLIRAAR
ncbi:hypothetical protein LJR129_004937 [Acidovorax sp. LjRoot129]|uniref:hypothetical protein n=1 Tax=unclassified Acidovorax TaxID=2684926 RepID=UPI003ECEC61D